MLYEMKKYSSGSQAQCRRTFKTRGDVLTTVVRLVFEVLTNLLSIALLPYSTSSFPSSSLIFLLFILRLLLLLLLTPLSGELRTQKLKSYLVRTQSLNVLPLKPGVGQYITIHAILIARDFFLAVSTFPVHSPAFFPKLLPNFPVLAVAFVSEPSR